tara:strand:+ start:1451 stop:1684 length:234 start_codon:yes stop_codon:yes gene_type:complete
LSEQRLAFGPDRYRFEQQIQQKQGHVMALIENKEEKCRAIQKRIEQGQGVCESCREIGVSEKTFYRWRRAREDASKS